ncbi:hypothetical protein MNBD_BACTEROID06-1011 [hydrothermal vent metagenome]|uniref:BioF2-like acetyltransferase domain-containing protein n=1 Tax=hydrothermal vent metagenome TaxID=652676 RepID=A0A3B0UF41_9ZZZZ
MNLATKKSLQIREITPIESMEIAHFFNSSSFLLNKPFKVKGWQLIGEQPLAQIFFYINEREAISGFQATFGSFDVSSSLVEQDLTWFVCELIQALKALKVKKIKIKGFPVYCKNSKLIHQVLLSSGFIESTKEINQHILITNLAFNQVAKRNEIKKIKQCVKNGFEFSKVSLESLPAIYELILKTRKRKQYSTSMTLKELSGAIKSNLENYFLFVVKHNEKMIAASVTVKINSKVLYNFYHADEEDYRSFSPLVYLVNNIYHYGCENAYKVLDLGISTMSGTLNEGLFTFKKNLGAQPTNKLIYSLNI